MTVLVEDTDEDSEPQLRARARRLGAAGIEGEFSENTSSLNKHFFISNSVA